MGGGVGVLALRSTGRWASEGYLPSAQADSASTPHIAVTRVMARIGANRCSLANRLGEQAASPRVEVGRWRSDGVRKTGMQYAIARPPRRASAARWVPGAILRHAAHQTAHARVDTAGRLD